MGVEGAKIAVANPLHPPAALADLDHGMLLLAVGGRGARNPIRDELATLQSDLVEGRNW